MAIPERWKGHPPLPEDLEDRLPEVMERLRRAGADLIYVFGSAAGAAAGDDDRPGDGLGGDPPADAPGPPGDLDLAVFGMKEDIAHVRADLAEIVGTDRLDLVQLERADPELRFEVVARGRLLHSGDPGLENDFELGVLREYRDLEPLRRLQNRYVRERHGIDGP